MLQKMEAAKAKAKENLEQQKVRRAKEIEKKRQVTMAELAQRAQTHEKAYEARVVAKAGLAAATGPDASRQAYYRDFKKVVEQADVILEVLDARDPAGCRCTAVEQWLAGKYPQKKIILVLNKIDLVPRDVVEQWLKHLRAQLPAVAFKCSTQTQRTHLAHATVPADLASADLLRGSECLGGDALMQLLKNYARSANLKTAISVGIIGYPNVGKSSLINSLKRSKVVGVGSTPGLTKSTQEIHLDKTIKLVDCPGIVFASGAAADAALRNAVKVEQLKDPIAPVELIMRRCRREQLQQLYAIPAFGSAAEFLVHIAKKKGKLKKGGVPDYDAAARTVLQDWNSGKIKYYTLPPRDAAGTHLGAAIVPAWGKSFALADVLGGDSKLLASLPAAAPADEPLMEMQPGHADDTELVQRLDAADTLEPDQDEQQQADEDDDDDDAQSDEPEDMEDTGAPAPAPAAVARGGVPRETATLPKPVAGRISKKGAAVLLEDAPLNPQANRSKKKQQKQLKKQSKKSAKQHAAHQDGDADAPAPASDDEALQED